MNTAPAIHSAGLEGHGGLLIRNATVTNDRGDTCLDALTMHLVAGARHAVVSRNLAELQCWVRMVARQVPLRSGTLGWAQPGKADRAPRVSVAWGADSVIAGLSVRDHLALGMGAASLSDRASLARMRQVLRALQVDWRLGLPVQDLTEPERNVLALARCLMVQADLYVLYSPQVEAADQVYLQRALVWLDAGGGAAPPPGHTPGSTVPPPATVVLVSRTLPLALGLSWLHVVRLGRTALSTALTVQDSEFWPVVAANSPESAREAVLLLMRNLQLHQQDPAGFAHQACLMGKYALAAHQVHCVFMTQGGQVRSTPELAGTPLAEAVELLRKLGNDPQASLPETVQDDTLQADHSPLTVLPLAHRGRVFALLLVQRTDNVVRQAEHTFLSEFSRVLHALLQDEEVQDRLRQGQRLDTLGSMASGLVHDFNNTLQAIEGASQLLLPKVQDAAGLRYLDIIRKAVRSSSSLTSQLLAFAKGQSTFKHTLDLHKTVQDALGIMRAAIHESVPIDCTLWQQPIWVRADAPALVNLFVNLGMNAGQAIDPGAGGLHAPPPGSAGRITIRTGIETVADDMLDLLGSRMQGSYACIEFRDTGRGMSAETLAHIFEPFYTTRKDAGGTGLGMSVVFHTLREHRGHIAIDSAPGAGTTVTIRLPVVSNPATGGAAPHAPGNLTVLVCDDNHLLRAVLTESLREHGLQVLEAANGADCVALYARHQTEIDVVVLDYRMPGMNGSECFNHLKALNPAVRAIILSGFTGEVETLDLLARGLRGVYRKPLDTRDLVDAIAQAMH